MHFLSNSSQLGTLLGQSGQCWPGLDRERVSLLMISPCYSGISPHHLRDFPHHHGISPHHSGISSCYSGISPHHCGDSSCYSEISPCYGGISPCHSGISPHHLGDSPHYHGISPYNYEDSHLRAGLVIECCCNRLKSGDCGLSQCDLG